MEGGSRVAKSHLSYHCSREHPEAARVRPVSGLAWHLTARVAEVAAETFRADIPPEQLAAHYQDAAEQRIGGAGKWLSEHGGRWDDDQGDRTEVIAGQFGLTDRLAGEMVDSYDEHHRAAALQLVEDVASLSTSMARLVLYEKLGGTRYIDDALAALQKQRPAQEQERPQRRRGGSGLSL